MATAQERVFEDKPAARAPTPLLFGLVGPSGSGKTFSALRLATGMQRVFGGDIYLIDTESRRALHYADKFDFRHVEFQAPFAPGDYLTAIDHCVNKGAKIVIVDSMSHEHEGPGGVLEWHQAEVERLMKAWSCNEQKANVPAWGKPKAARRRLINSILQYDCNFIFCFRAKDKIKINSGKGKTEIVQLGFMPIAGEEFVYELTAKALLLPGANGVPTWQPEGEGERMMVKLPEQFRGIFSGAEGQPMSEDVGQQMATWAAGDEGDSPAEDLLVGYGECNDQATFDQLEAQRGEVWPRLSTTEKKRLKTASEDAKQRIADAETEADALEP